MSVIKKQHIYLPKRHLDHSKWAVIASGQFSGDKDYWDKLSLFVAGNPSTLDLVLPDVFLGKEKEDKIKNILKSMRLFYENGILEDAGLCMILVNRSTGAHKKRLGIMLAVDLEEFECKEGTAPLIRPSEGTISERIPPRLEVRRDAVFELPHIVLFYDDREERIAEKLFEKRESLEKVYDFDLNMQGGHLCGYKIRDVEEVIKKFEALLEPGYLQRTFNASSPLLFVVGDGNHSLASAKAHWNNVKTFLSEEEKISHPARFALVEAINIHDEGIEFKPIFRVLKNANKKIVKDLQNLHKKAGVNKADENSFSTEKIFTDGKELPLVLPKNTALAIKLVQDFIERKVSEQLEMSVDYVHDVQRVKEICDKDKRAIGITLPALDKNELFAFILKHGILPRKAFSVGDAREKRYYFEARKIRLI